VVVAERSFLSTVVYQLLAPHAAERSGLDAAWFDDLTRRVHGACLPDAIFVLDVPADVAAGRRRARADDRIEARAESFHRRVRDGFVRAAEREVRAHVLDASRPFDAVQAELRRAVRELLP